MLKHQARRVVALLVLVDVAATACAWVAAFYLRFYGLESVLPITKGIPDLTRYALLLPLIAVLWPVVLYFHGLYQVKRGRSRIDELFGIVFSVLIGSALTLGATLYLRVYHFYQPDVAPLWEYSQAVFVVFIALGLTILAAPAFAAPPVRFRTIEGFASPGTPAELNKVGILEIGPRGARNILVLNPGTSASAASSAARSARSRPCSTGSRSASSCSRVAAGSPTRRPSRRPSASAGWTGS